MSKAGDTLLLKSAVPAADRMRHYRARRRNGGRSVRIAVEADELEALVRKGYLDAGLQDDRNAVAAAIEDYVADLLWWT